MTHRAPRPAFTFVELLVALAVLGLLLSVAALSAPPLPAADDARTEVARIRRVAVERARSMHLHQRAGAKPLLVHALPDGRLLVDSTVGPTVQREAR